MSANYFIPSLPMLHLDAPAPMTPEAYVAAAQDQLSAADAAAVAALVTNAPCDHPFVRAWRDKDTIIRNAIVSERTRINGGDATRWQKHADGCDVFLTTRVAQAFQESNPLKREKRLDQIRWDAADELVGPDALSVRTVFAYAIKLTILKRWTTVCPDKGADVFNTLTETPMSL